MDRKVVTEEKRIEEEVGEIINENRVVGFSDAVFAFAATLLVLKIDLPAVEASQISNNFPSVFATLWPQYLANIISFLIIGYYWLNHHVIFALVKRINIVLVWINILFLILLSFIPFPVDLYGSYSNTPIVVAFYSASLSAVGFMLSLIWLYASGGKRLIDKNLSQRKINYYTLRILAAPIVFAAAAFLAFVDTGLAQFAWLLVLIAIFIINSIFRYKRPSEIEKLSAA